MKPPDSSVLRRETPKFPVLKLVGGWPTPLKNDGVSNSWDDDIPNVGKNKSHVPNHQPENQRLVFHCQSSVISFASIGLVISGGAPSAADYLPETADACPGHVGTRHFGFGSRTKHSRRLREEPKKPAARSNKFNNSVGTESTNWKPWKPKHFVAAESWESSPLG